MKENTLSDFSARTFQGFEHLTEKELQAIGAKNITVRKRTVDFQGTTETMYKANLHLRTATKIVKKVYFFKALNENHLQKNLLKVNWSDYLTPKDRYSLSMNINSKFFKNLAVVNQAVRNSIDEHFKQKQKEFTPAFTTEKPDISFQIHGYNDFFTIYIDSTGDFLFNRNYKAVRTEEDLNEVMAAGMIMLSGWKANTTFIDPMCGTGTIAFEAALMANNIAPGIYREFYGFMKWKDFDKNLWEKVVSEAKQQTKPSKVKIYAYDIEPSLISIAKKNLLHANLHNKIQFEVNDVFSFKPPAEKSTLVFEPPCTERIGKLDILVYYEKLGNRLKESLSSCTLGILCTNKDALAKINLNPRLKVNLLLGKTECFFYKFEIFEKKNREDDF